MSNNTKIVVLHLKEIIYTGIFALLGILFIVLLIIMFLPKNDKEPSTDSETATEEESVSYQPGVYSTGVSLGDQNLDIEVIVDENNINSIQIVNLTEDIATMYPLVEPSFNSICEQILSTQSLEDITYSEDSKYTSLVLLEAIRSSLDKATPAAADAETE